MRTKPAPDTLNDTAYTTAVTGYDDAYRPLGTTVTIWLPRLADAQPSPGRASSREAAA